MCFRLFGEILFFSLQDDAMMEKLRGRFERLFPAEKRGNNVKLEPYETGKESTACC